MTIELLPDEVARRLPKYPFDDMPTVNGKPWYKSKTLWFNGLCAMLAMAELNFKLLEGRIPGGFYTWMAFVLPVGNALLRIITSSALIMPRVDQPAPPLPPSGSQGGFMSANVLICLSLLAALLAMSAAVFQAGKRSERSDWLQREAQRLAIAAAEKDRQASLAQIAAAFEIQEQLRAAERQTYFEGVMKHARSQFSLTRQPAVRASGACIAGAGVSGGLPADGAAQPEQNVFVLPVPFPAEPELTLGAVGLWNAALSGQPRLAAGACRVDETTGQAGAACSDGSGLDFDAAFANHAINAASCREDRARHQRLIDFLQRLPLSRSPTPATN